jgi:hypothetical protein
MRTFGLTILVLLVATTVEANPRGAIKYEPEPISSARVKPVDTSISPIIYLNRCVGGCTIIGGSTNDASSNMSSLPCAMGGSCSNGSCMCQSPAGGTYTVGEFQSSTAMTGAAADPEWNALVKCVKEVYSPYAVTVTDVAPAPGSSFTEGIVAGVPEDIGWKRTEVGGIAVVSAQGACVAKNNIMSFSFANIYGGPTRILDMCWTAAQETAHSFGLDHEYEFADGSSACNSPMTYRFDCGGEKFFRNQAAKCGEAAVRTCCSGGLQDSHQKLVTIFGPGTPITTPPHVEIGTPTGGTIPNGTTVTATSGAQRGVARLELWLNNHKWVEAKGAPFSTNGQPDPSGYTLTMPAKVPDGVIDIIVKAFDDIEIEGDSATVTVTKGVPCASAATCLDGQKCDAGKCYWDPPTGEIGDACTYNEFCKNNICADVNGQKVCSESCIVGSTDACPMGFTCADAGGMGFCVPPDNGGCCSVSNSRAVWAQLGLTGLVLGVLLRRRKR